MASELRRIGRKISELQRCRLYSATVNDGPGPRRTVRDILRAELERTAEGRDEED